MDYHQLRQLILELLRSIYLKNNGNFQLPAMQSTVVRFAIERKFLKNGQNFSEDEGEDLLDIVNSLILEGILRWGYNFGNAGPPFMGLTKYGRTVLQSEEPIPNDPYGYLQKLEQKIPNIDENVRMYLEESLLTFQKNTFMASAIMLGVAAEGVFNILYDSLIDSVTSTKIKDELQKIRDSAKTKRRIDLLRETILVKCKDKIPRKLTDDFESKTDPLFNLIRQIRNDVGHPTGITVDRMTMFVNLQLFVPYCETSYTWVDFLNKNKL